MSDTFSLVQLSDLSVETSEPQDPLLEFSGRGYTLRAPRAELQAIWLHFRQKFRNPVLVIPLLLLCGIILIPALCMQRGPRSGVIRESGVSNSTFTPPTPTPRSGVFRQWDEV